MSDSELEIQDLDYDMWEGQFEFLGPHPPNAQPHGLLKPAPYMPHTTNGVKKTSAHAWCDNVTDKMQLLQQQVGVLQDSSSQNDERYTRVKAENAALQARINMLEEQLQDTELRCEERLQVTKEVNPKKTALEHLKDH